MRNASELAPSDNKLGARRQRAEGGWSGGRGSLPRGQQRCSHEASDKARSARADDGASVSKYGYQDGFNQVEQAVSTATNSAIWTPPGVTGGTTKACTHGAMLETQET